MEDNKYYELDYLGIDEGKSKIRESAKTNVITYPSFKQVLDRRWRALITTWNKTENISTIPKKSNLNINLPEMLHVLIEICAEQNLMAEQREIYYSVRGRYPNLKINDELWIDLYNNFIGNYMNKVQLIVKMPMQSFGVEAGARGSVAGEGHLILENGNRVPLNAEPKLRFELVRAGVKYTGRGRKHIHYEKEAGFARLISGDVSKMIEAIFSTSQGYSSEAASKFIRDSEERGMKTYCLHDGDPHGIQMQMMYGVASKNNCYMTDRFYPHNVVYLGLVPTVARAIGLPPEKIDDGDRKIIPNLRVLLQEKGEFIDDINIIDEAGEKWEYQALNALHEKAPQSYMIEALRARGDEIKYVPEAEEIKKGISDSITVEVSNLVENSIVNIADNFYESNIKADLIEQIKNKLQNDIADFDIMMKNELPKLAAMDNTDIREAVKLKLVDNPRQYWDSGQYQVMKDMLSQKFEINADIKYVVDVTNASAKKDLSIVNPTIPAKPLTKNDIVDSIQRRVIAQKPQRDTIVNPIRKALEKIFGMPDLTW